MIDLIDQIGRHWNGAMAVFDNTENGKSLERFVDLENGKLKKIFWGGEIPSCDICDNDMVHEHYMVDGSLPGGAWANMCAKCFEKNGVGIGWGVGQLYLKTDEGWLLVGGFQQNE